MAKQEKYSLGQIAVFAVLALVALFLTVTIILPLVKAIVSLLVTILVLGGAIWFAYWVFQKLNDSGN